MGWKILILVPKGNADTQGIGLLDALYKVTKAIIDTCIKKAVTFHVLIPRFRSRRGTGTPIVELKLAQDLASVEQDPLFLVFL